MPYIFKVFDNLHMQWMGVLIHHHSIFTAGSSDLGKQGTQNCRGLLLGYRPYHYTSIEALDPPRVDHTSMSYIYKVFDNLHMQWMGIWIHHHFIIMATGSPDL